jgi:pentatricopeptide repeat protein
MKAGGYFMGSIVEPDLVMWNSIISGYGYCGFWDKGLRLFSRMRNIKQKNKNKKIKIHLIYNS